MTFHIARTGVLAVVLSMGLAAPPCRPAHAAPEPSTAPASPPAGSMRHGAYDRALALRDSLPAPDVDSLIAQALAGSPDLKAIEARQAGARRAAERSGGLMGLNIGAMYERAHIPFPVSTDGGGGHGGEAIDHTTMNMFGPDIELELPFPGGGRARRSALEGEADLFDAELESGRRRPGRGEPPG